MNDLDYICSECDGSGYITDEKENEHQCYNCHGDRRILTEKGRELIEFIERWTK